MRSIITIIIVGLLNLSVAVYAAESKLETFAASPMITSLVLKLDDGKIKSTYKTAYGEEKENDSVADKSFRYAFDRGETKAIYYRGFNPLEVAVKLESTEEKTGLNDPGPFFQALSAYSPIFLGKSAIEPVKPVPEDKIKAFAIAGQVKAVQVDNTECAALITKYHNLTNAYNNVASDANEKDTKTAINELAVTDKLIGGWKIKTNSASGIDEVTKSIGELTAKLDANVAKIKAAVNEIVNTPDKGYCSSLPVIVVAETSFIMNKASEAITHREAASSNLKALSDYLKKYSNGWVGSDYKIGYISQPAKQNLKKVTVTVKKIDISTADDKATIKESDKNSTSATFVVYQNEKVVFEPAVGYVYSPLRSNKFSTKTVNGNQVVEKTAKNDDHHAAAFLNVYYTEWIKENVYPFWQVGVSTAKDYPALLTGLGMKIRDTSFAFSVGAAFGFIQELDKLSEGQTVAGQADIDKDVKTTVKPSWYLSLQYSF